MKNYTSTDDGKDNEESLPRVCFLMESFYPLVGGVQAHARLLARHLQSKGVKAFVLTRRTDLSLARSDIVDGIPVYRIPPSGVKSFKKYVMIPFAILELIRRRKDYDVICVCCIRTLGIPAVIASLILGKVCLLRVESQGEMSGSYISVYEKPSFIANSAFRLYLWFRNNLLRRADAFASICETIASEYECSGVDPTRIFRIPNGVDADLFHPADSETRRLLRAKLQLPADGPIIAYTGRLVQGKGLEHLIRAWKQVVLHHGDARLMLIGSGGDSSLSCEDELHRQIREDELTSSVIFTGSVENVHEYLQASDMFVFPTEYDAMPLAVTEAASCSLPIIATRIGGIPDIIRHLENGILVEPGDPDALAWEIINLLDRPQLARSLAVNARRTVCERYSIKVVSQRYVELFSSLHAVKRMEPNRIVKIYNNLFLRQNWNIGIVSQPIQDFLAPDFKPKIHWLPLLPDGEFRADPFGVVKDGKIYILCEEYDYSRRRGLISGLELDTANLITHAQVVMDMPFHMSYPYIIVYGGELYCIPETFEVGEVGLYKAQEFPSKWIKVATLIENVAAVDSTVFQYEGRWWLVCTDQDQNPDLKLLIWYAPDLFGPWRPHAANPVKVDIRSARPAGTPFVHEGRLYRPAQDCSRVYGGAIVLNRVIKLTPTEFEEEQAKVIWPFADSPYPDGLHTISAVGDVTLVDGCRKKFIKKAFKSSLKSALNSCCRTVLFRSGRDG